MTRRAMLFVLAAARARAAADPASQVWNVLTAMANALTVSDSAAFLLYFDPHMAGFDDFRLAVEGLLKEFSVNSSISPIENEGNDRSRTLKVDWSMHLVSLNGVDQVTHSEDDLDQVTQREDNVTLKMERRGRKWKVVSFQPANFFQAPPRGGMPPPPKL
jgi:hypothetical protein